MRYATALFLILSGCMVGPKYQKPDVAMPEHFEQLPSGVASEEEDLSHWWKQFHDPVLDQLIEEATHANYDLQIALEKIEQTRAQYRIERSHLWPEIDLNATAMRSRISQNFLPTPAGAAPGVSVFPRFLNIFQVGFDAIWEFDFFGKFRHAKNAAHLLWEASKDDYNSALISMLSEVAINYIGVRALQNKIALIHEKIEVDEEELAIADSLFDVGIDNELQITTLISRIETDRAELPVLETSLKQTIYALAYLLGRQPEGLMAMFAEVCPIPTAEGKLPVGIPSDLLRRRPDVRSAERQLAAATEQTGAAIADYFPHFALTGISFSPQNSIGSSIGQESNKLGQLFKSASRMFSFGLGMNWNLIDFGRVRGNVDVKNSLQRQALITYEQTVTASLKDVESALVAYFEEQDRRDSLLRKVEADRLTYEITTELLKTGLANDTQVLEAQKALIDSETTFIESEQALAGDLIAIYKAIGGTWN
jgi:outer membrane protein, multidrug efflux system